MQEISLAFVTNFIPLVKAFARYFFTDHEMSSLPMRAEKRISGRFVNNFLTISQLFPIFIFDVVGDHPYTVWRLCKIARFLPIRSTFPRISTHALPHQKTKRRCPRGISPSQIVPAEISESSNSLLSCAILKFGWHSHCVHSKYT